MARHLREQSGGNPADHGPAPELANRPASPRSTEDFPDAPEPSGASERRSGPGGDLSDEQLHDFASRFGLTDDEATAGERSDGERSDDRASDDQPRSSGTARRADTERVAGVRGRIAGTLISGVRRPVGRALIVASRGVGAAGRWLRSTGERIAPR